MNRQINPESAKLINKFLTFHYQRISIDFPPMFLNQIHGRLQHYCIDKRTKTPSKKVLGQVLKSNNIQQWYRNRQRSYALRPRVVSTNMYVVQRLLTELCFPSHEDCSFNQLWDIVRKDKRYNEIDNRMLLTVLKNLGCTIIKNAKGNSYIRNFQIKQHILKHIMKTNEIT
jgi:hypothetical protein